MRTELILSIIGLIGGLLCCAGDLLLDLKGKDNKKLGKYGIADSKWLEMGEWRFKLSIIVVMFAVPMYALGIYSLGEQIGGAMGTVLKLTALVGSMGGFFIHAFLCFMPIAFKSIPDKEQGLKTVDKMFESVVIPFFALYIILTLVPTILVVISIINGSLDVPMFCVLLNPIVFLIIGVVLRAIKYDWFYDLPGIIMPSLGLGMFGLIGILNLT